MENDETTERGAMRKQSEETGADVGAGDMERRASLRIERWGQKLLDFSARNRLLNMPRSSRQTIRLVPPDVAALEDALAANRPVAIRSIAETLGEQALADLAAGRMATADCRGAAEAELAANRLCAALSPRELGRRLSDLMHDARTGQEETGANTLFLAIGELQWMEAGCGANRKAYRAPILLMPVGLQRSSMADGVKLRRLDEETTVNTTLLEFLRSQFGIVPDGLEALPADASGVDVARVLGAFRESVKGREGWGVMEEAALGCFSFGKFVMWRELTAKSGELRRNRLVNHLAAGGGNFDDGVEVFPVDEVARHAEPGDLFCPVGCDSSQLAAVLYSEAGKTFVLHGPPGTGKSQTITNIIAHNLAKGRRVLFVSEKKAALDVVKTRLDRVGLAPFCLELHSNKTEKARFYAQIKEALDVPEASEPAERDRALADLMRCRAELDAYVKALHSVHPNGLTAYDCFAAAIRDGGEARPGLIDADCLTQERDDYLAARQAVRDLQNAYREVSADALAATPGLKADAWSPELESALAAAARSLSAAACALAAALDGVLPPLGISVRGDAMRVGDAVVGGCALGAVLGALKASGKASRRFFDASGRNTPGLLKELLEMRERHAALAEGLRSYRLDRLAELDLDSLAGRLEANSRRVWPLRFFGGRAIAREMSGFVRPGASRPDAASLVRDLPVMRELVALERAFREKAGCGIDETAEAPEGVREAAATADVKRAAFEAALGEYARFTADDVGAMSLGELALSCERLADRVGELRNVMRWRKAAGRAAALGAGAFAVFIAERGADCADAVRAFDAAYAAKMLSAILSHSPELAEFSGLGQDERVARFRELDAKCTGLARLAVVARLAASLPHRAGASRDADAELGMVRRECGKKTRRKAVRQFIAESRTILPALKPCFLMSPLSVAQYLPLESPPFDLVVFDEASQIPVWDAISALARGKQAIVVGDPRQMPPTSFFQKGEGDGEEDEEEEVAADQESILDECLAAGVYSARLDWHYRSRHESLIAFSNEHYYSNRLCTFPAASFSPSLGVKFKFVPGGCFARTGGKIRVNEPEARALVDYVCEKVRGGGARRRSIGIVTFSMPQQKLIRTMLEERRAADPELERLLPEDGEGAYFVKNLENVQGDESDVILFSIGYAPDEEGRFTMNFGPLNLAGGERRLNVAVTRAKEQIVVFSSIRASQIDAGEGGRTKAVGAAHLKAFLEYAERVGAENATAAPVSPSAPRAAAKGGGEGGDAFADAVAAFLAGEGYGVDRRVGRGGYRIDIALRRQDRPDGYVAGIECDGADYARQRTAQDRDVNRPGVLAGLGWHMCRAWCVDWALDRRRAQQRLLEEIRR